MKKVYLMKGIAVMALGLTIASCSKDVFDPNALQAQNEEAFNNNFQKSVLNNQEIDENQTWSTATTLSVQVTVDLDYGEEYTVYFYTTPPLMGNNEAYIGVGKVKSGETTTVVITKPTDAVELYAALYDKDSHAICKSFAFTGDNSQVKFSNKENGSTSNAPRRATSSGNRWSVTPQNMPNLSAYTTGTLYEMEEAFNTNGSTVVNQADGSEKHLKITGSYSGSIARIQSYANQSVYVTGTWTVPENQSCTGGSAIVVGNGGKIVIPNGHKLSTNANNNAGTTGMVYVLPGGSIEGPGELQFSNGTETFSYNAGSITVGKININGGTLYNAGTIGNPTNTQTALEGPSTGSLLVNLGHAYFTQVSGAGMAIHNACNIYVTGDLALGNSSKMDNGSYIQCGTLHLNGSNNGNIVLYMGNAAYMNCRGDISVNNFGVWGPISNNGGAINNAIFKIGGCSYCNYTSSSDASYYMVDNVELIIPDPFFDEGVKNFYTSGVAGQLNTGHADYYNALLFYGWFNGQGCQGINSDNYKWVQIQEQGHSISEPPYWVVDVPGWQGHVLKDDASFYMVDESRATCIYGTSPSYTVTVDATDNCGVNINKGSDPTPSPNFVYYAFEDLGTTDDFDFNDVVLRVSARNAEGKCSVDLMAAGGTMSTIVTYNGRQIGTEVHSAFETDSEKIMVNTDASDGVSKDFVNLSTIQVDADADLTNLPLGITCQSGSSVINVTRTAVSQNSGRAPLVIVVSGNSAGKWFWPKERVNISTAYTQFGAWGADVSSYPKWYLNYANGKVYSW